MEEELRYYYGFDKYETLLKTLKNFDDLEYKGCFYEITTQYDHPDIKQSFYNKNVDGRFRVRCSKNIENENSSAKISWKKRNVDTFNGIVNKEEEIEINFNYSELHELEYLLEKVIKMKKIESYERYRNVFDNEDIEIVVDKYPFGIALEIENKSKTKNAEKTILYWLDKLKLKSQNAYRLSWDDKYTELCKKQNIEIFKQVKFGLPMPKIMD